MSTTTIETPAEHVQRTELTEIEQRFATREREIDRDIEATKRTIDRTADKHLQEYKSFDRDNFSNIPGYREACDVVATE